MGSPKWWVNVSVVPATRSVLVTGAIPEEPAVTRVVAAGSVVLCGSVQFLCASSNQLFFLRFFGGTFSAKYSSRMARAFTHVAAGCSAYISRVADSLLPPDCEIALP